MVSEKLLFNYELASKIVSGFFAGLNEEDAKIFRDYFHIRPRTDGIFLVSVFTPYLSMREKRLKNGKESESLAEALTMLKELNGITDEKEIKAAAEAYGFSYYKKGHDEEYRMQADFIRYLPQLGLTLIASEFMFERGEKDVIRPDLIAKDTVGNLWIFEMKAGKANPNDQLTRYKNAFLENRDAVFSLLSLSPNYPIAGSARIKTGWVSRPEYIYGDATVNAAFVARLTKDGYRFEKKKFE